MRVIPGLSEKPSEQRGTQWAEPGDGREGLPRAELHLPGLMGTES